MHVLGDKGLMRSSPFTGSSKDLCSMRKIIAVSLPGLARDTDEVVTSEVCGILVGTIEVYSAGVATIWFTDVRIWIQSEDFSNLR
jgi:hypothetical protein